MIRQNAMTKEEVKAALIECGIRSFKKGAGFIPQKLQEQCLVGSNVKDNGMFFKVSAIRRSIQEMKFRSETIIVVEGIYCHVTVNEHNIILEESDIPF